ncbi:MAG: hypothetical protein ACLGI2_17905 [Acidimicrobiia bacterium]
MPSEGAGNSEEISERVARGFEALVDEGPLAVPTPPPAPPPRPPDVAAAAPPAPAVDPARLDALEARVRQTMDRLTELVEAQLPEAVDGLRADLETLRLELQTSLATATSQVAEERRELQAALAAAAAQQSEERRQLRAELQAALDAATDQFADERSELRSQIATTVGAANRWFVRTRDQLYDRLDYLASLAAYDQQAPPRPAPVAPTTQAALPAGDPSAGGGAGTREGEAGEGGIEWEVEGDGAEGYEGYEVAPPAPPAGDVARGTDLEPLPVAAAAIPDVAPWTPPQALDVALDPVRGDLQELQVEVAAMGDALVGLRDELERLRQRVPAVRPRGVRLEPGQIELIVEAIMAVLPSLLPAPPPPAPPSRKRAAAPAKKAASATRKAPAKKAARARKAAPRAAKAVTVQPRRTPAFPRLYTFEDTD